MVAGRRDETFHVTAGDVAALTGGAITDVSMTAATEIVSPLMIDCFMLSPYTRQLQHSPS